MGMIKTEGTVSFYSNNIIIYFQPSDLFLQNMYVYMEFIWLKIMSEW